MLFNEASAFDMADDLEAEASQPKPTSKKPKGFALTALVYEELSRYAALEFSTAELMAAAQRLVQISKGEYVDHVSKEYEGRPNYYALNLMTAFRYYPWLIVTFETPRIRHCDYPEHSPECLEEFRAINLSLNDRVWEF